MPKKNRKKPSIAKRDTGSVRLKALTKKKVLSVKSSKKKEKVATVKPTKKKKVAVAGSLGKKATTVSSSKKTGGFSKKKATSLARSKKHLVSVPKRKATKKTPPKTKKQIGLAKRKPSSTTARTAASKIESSALLSATKIPHQKSSRYLSDKDRNMFRELLLKWRCDLVEEIDETMHQLRDEEGQQADFNDRATIEEEFALQLKNQDRERKLIRKIDQSLRNIDMNEYGYCEKCGEEIGIGRLKARPTATLCIECKTLSEIKERQFA